jgi:hypothetical protein
MCLKLLSNAEVALLSEDSEVSVRGFFYVVTPPL